MNVRFWLSVTGKNATMTKQQEVSKEIRDVTYLGDHVVRDEYGQKYIDLPIDPTSPASWTPQISRKYIERVTYVGTYSSGCRTNGIYKFRGAIARVVDKAYPNTPWQEISISAGSLRTLREIYSKVRKGELIPSEDWSICQP